MNNALAIEPLRSTELGDLPGSWEVIGLGEALTQAQYGLSVRGQKSGSYPILRMNCQERGRVIFRDLQFVDLDDRTLESYRLNDGDILFNRTNSHELVGRCALFEGSRTAVFASYLLRLATDRSKLLPDFLNFYLASESAQESLKSFATRGVSQSNISASKLRLLRVPRPSIDEQRTIAGVLSKLQSAVKMQDRVAATLKELKAATMAKLFRDGLRNEPLKQTDIGEIPESWDVVPMRQAAEISKGQVDPRAEPYAGLIHIGPEDVEEATGRLLHPRTARELGLVSGKYAFRRDDIVFSKIRPYLRKSVLAEFDGICSADMYPLHPLEGFEGSFLHAVSLSESFTVQATAQQARTGIPKLNREQLNTILVPKPALKEQRDIGKYLAILALRLRVALGRRAALNALFSSMLQLLVTGQLRLPAGHEGASP